MRRLICSGNHLPYDPDLVELAQKLRRNMTRQEKKLWYEFLRYKKPPFYKQRPIDCYIVDFYNPASKLVIELDGWHHYTKEGLEADEDRDANLKGYELTILRFTNDEIDNDFNSVCQKIQNHCKTNFA